MSQNDQSRGHHPQLVRDLVGSIQYTMMEALVSLVFSLDPILMVLVILIHELLFVAMSLASFSMFLVSILFEVTIFKFFKQNDGRGILLHIFQDFWCDLPIVPVVESGRALCGCVGPRDFIKFDFSVCDALRIPCRATVCTKVLRSDVLNPNFHLNIVESGLAGALNEPVFARFLRDDVTSVFAPKV